LARSANSETGHGDAGLSKDAGQRKYHVTVVCGDDIPYDNTWDRSGAANRAVMQEWTLEELTARGVPFVLLRGSVQDRMQEVTEKLAAWPG
jgi:HTH-type transcriptional regulator, transcriptional repressor of NAD biosynthesis genes